ncbi:hypothetical protein P4O66_003579 [Electrophorus voltai]|uniref:Uncharacterized protein n=1 Tax=Electrophorus voltai TaxID=2609070 RepID=A0AAD8ZT51_9TELE|nr:hypothetical protein P4O66_003579 [Electrophorus voltai]
MLDRVGSLSPPASHWLWGHSPIGWHVGSLTVEEGLCHEAKNLPQVEFKYLRVQVMGRRLTIMSEYNLSN